MQQIEFPYCYADVAKESGRKPEGSNVYEVHPWLWPFGRGKPRLGGLSLSKTEVLRMAVKQEGVGRGYAIQTNMKRGRNALKAAAAQKGRRMNPG